MKYNYIKALIKQINPTGNVLQVGFYSEECVQEIQKYHPKSHTLIETDPARILQAKKCAPALTLIESPWETALSKLGVFDTLLFTSTSSQEKPSQEKLPSEPKKAQSSPTSKAEKNTLSFHHGSATIEMAEKMFPYLSSIQYSDEDLDTFLKTIPFSIKYVVPFLEELKMNGQITEEQIKRVLLQDKQPPETFIDPLILFLKSCLMTHMHDKSLASWITPNYSSKYDCPDFFEQIITESNVSYEEYPHDETQFLMILKKG